MIEVVRDARVAAPAPAVWAVVSDPGLAGQWFSFAERVEVLSGNGVGQLRRQYGRWGAKESQVDQEVTRYEPDRVLAWKHLAERLGGKPAPRFAKSTNFSIELEPDGTGTRVLLRSRQEPAGALKGLVIKAFGTKEVGQQMERSLERLAGLVNAC